MGGERESGIAGVEREELRAELGEVDFLRIVAAIGLCSEMSISKGKGSRWGRCEGVQRNKCLRGGPWCE